MENKPKAPAGPKPVPIPAPAAPKQPVRPPDTKGPGRTMPAKNK